MKVSWLPFKIIHSDSIMKLNHIGDAQPYLTVRHEVHNVSEQKQLPFAMRLTYRIHTLKDNKAVFSIIGEGKSILEFEKGEDPTNDLRNLLSSYLLQIQLHWEEKIKRTNLIGQTIRPMEKTVEDNIISDVIKVAKESDLL